jgi:hypothetical protein
MFIWKKEYKELKEKSELYDEIQSTILFAISTQSEPVDTKRGGVTLLREYIWHYTLKFPLKRVLDLVGIPIQDNFVVEMENDDKYICKHAQNDDV